MESILYQPPRQEIEYIISGTKKSSLQMVPHVHRELEFIYMVSGETIAVADGQRVKLTAGDAFVAMPGQVHSYEKGTNEEFIGFRINPDILPEFKSLMESGIPSTPLLSGIGNREDVKTLLRLFSATKGDSAVYAPELRRGYLLSLFAIILPLLDYSRQPVSTDELRNVVSFCNTHYCEELTLDSLADGLHMSRYAVSRLFSTKLGMGFNDYINSLRVTKACRMLTGSDSPVTDICMDVGFSTLRTFNRAFLKETGMTPSEYRKATQQEPVTASPLPKKETPVYHYPEADYSCCDDMV